MYLTENAPFLEHFLFYLAIVVYLVPYLVAFDIFLLVSSKGLQFRNSKGAVTRGNCYCNLQATALQCPVFECSRHLLRCTLQEKLPRVKTAP